MNAGPKVNMRKSKVKLHDHELGTSLVKSNFLATIRFFVSSRGDVCLRFSLLPTPSPPLPPVTLPAFSSIVCAVRAVLHLGSLEGCVGWGRAEK